MCRLLLMLLVAFTVSGQNEPEPEPEPEPHYRHYDEMTAYLMNMTELYPRMTRLHSIGNSVQGRKLWVLVLTSNIETPTYLAPNVKFVANMHGNEGVGRELLLYLAKYLLEGYGTDLEATRLLDSMIIHLLPSMNPDGFEEAVEGECKGDGRYNTYGFDLNRNFPDPFRTNQHILQAESLAVIEWLRKVPFVLSANLHGGALVASYPLESTPEPRWETYLTLIREEKSQVVMGMYTPSPSADDDVFQHLALTYSKNHRNMWEGKPCDEGSHSFPDGIINGAKWYPVVGSMQDYNYVYHGCMEITLELSCCKYPPAKDLPRFWNDNKKALLVYLSQSLRGVKGTVRNFNDSKPIYNATLRIANRDANFTSDEDGHFWRILLPGRYTLLVRAAGFQLGEVPFNVEDDHVTILNVTLKSNDHVDTTTAAAPTTTVRTRAVTPQPVVHATTTHSVVVSDNNPAHSGVNGATSTLIAMAPLFVYLFVILL